ncbi:hypothetical protein VTJ83DRAFT_472 [Remersonia thermophila]|uniref:Cell wall proline rich protein n=1 Tax=Remersonia thermophila TaxID=72144 RepID=A0ABR4DM71_9PEZI
MATTVGPDMMMIDPSTPDSPGLGPMSRYSAGLAAADTMSPNPQSLPRSNPPPPPNPPFVFPPRPSSSSASTSYSRPAGRRPMSAIEPRTMMSSAGDHDEKPVSRSPALPAFSFNPGASLPPAPRDNMFLSPPESPSAPSSPRLSPTRPSGLRHRRGGSEFVGGKIRDGEAITVLAPTPAKPEGAAPSPSLQPTRPRRGHAHRRSAAISSHDLSSIIIPPSNLGAKKGDSAPASPNLGQQPFEMKFPAPATPAKTETAASTPAPRRSAERLSSPPTPTPQAEQTPKSNARNRVGFSDTLEYIPRPVSMVSTDTSSTVTAKPGHSVSGSISSVMSITVERDMSAFQPSAPRGDDCRPSTAGAVMERTQTIQEHDPSLPLPRRRGSIPLLGALPSLPLSPATPSPTKASKKWAFFGRDPAAGGSPTRAQPDSPRSTVSHLSILARNSLDRVRDMAPEPPNEQEETPKPLAKKRSKKQKKVKKWAGTILSRKGKYRHGKQKKRAPTPPPPRPLELEDDADDASLNMASEPELGGSQSPENEDWKSWTFPKPAPASDDYPMIDLDAALGPFNTPLPRNLEWEAAQKAGGLHKKQLHSAAGMSRFTGPGMHYYHRRAESAPELAPFEAARFGFPRFGSSSTMADVFEEDEEEEEEESKGVTAGAPRPAAGTSAEKPKDHPSVQAEPAPEAGFPSGPRSDGAVTPATPAESAATQDKDTVSDAASKVETTASTQPTIPSDSDIIFVDPCAPFMREAPGTPPCSAISCVETPSPRQVCRPPKDLAPVDVSPLHLPSASLGPASPWSMTQSSSAFPSPRSPMSYDAHCISTAPSSITDDNFESLLMGEPGPEVRISVDDIPSLTSSNSTMTRDSLFATHNPQARIPPLSADLPRPASFTSTAFGRRRSSLASLSRLINSSHGERSKLSIEVTADSEPEKKAKASKAKRLSRMMQFWKPKEGKTA